MNILFVNYGDFTTNSLNHIGAFANALTEAGHACVVAVPSGKETLTTIPSPLFQAALFEEVLQQPRLFEDGREADVIHAWTPRENVRRFVVAYQQVSARPARLVVHLEDNEEELLQAYTRQTLEDLRAESPAALRARLPDTLCHPHRLENLLRLADAVTVIVDALREMVPASTPVRRLFPGVDLSFYRPMEPDESLRAELGIRPGERVVTYTGSTSFANEDEMRELYLAVELLNKQGLPSRLLRTGFTSPQFRASLPEDAAACAIDLGLIAKTRLPALLALADVLVQPGHRGRYNDFRLPSKIPEFLASGRPVVAPDTNIGLLLRDGIEALLLRDGSPEEIAAACRRVFEDPRLAAELGRNGRAFAERHFELTANVRALATLYADLLAASPRCAWKGHPDDAGAGDLSLILERSLPVLHDNPALARNLLAQIRALEYDAANLPKPDAAIEEIERKLDLTARHAGNLEALVDRLGHNLKKAQRHAETLGGMVRRSQQDLDKARQHANELEAVRHMRDDKIRRMQESFSWRVTSPLRALRRLIGGKSRPIATTSGARSPDRIADFEIDEPQTWIDLDCTRLAIRGWFVRTDLAPVAAIRARWGDTIFEARLRLPRTDVKAAFPDHPHAAEAGFLIEATLSKPGGKVVLEHADVSGAWSPFFSVEATFTDDASDQPQDRYSVWRRHHEDHSPGALRRQRDRAASWPAPPRISILLPVYNAPERWLRRAVESVIEQSYPRWELCVADDASTAPHVRPTLEALAARDSRIKVAFRPENGHISAASNSALELATGDWIALLDHDDELAPDALFEVASILIQNPDADLVYSDEDKISENGERSLPYFKPEFLPDLFTGQNFISHLAVYRAALVRKIGGFRVGYEGSQDWDLALRFIEQTTPARIRHIPKILYHWRAIPGSTATNPDQKSYAADAGGRAIEDHLQRQSIEAAVLPVSGGYWRVKYTIPHPPPLVSLIIPTRNGLHLLRQCVESILEKTTYRNFEILIVDNGSDDPSTVEWMRHISRSRKAEAMPEVRLLRDDGPFNYSALNNAAVAEARGEFIGLINNDLEVITPEWLEEMASHAARPGVGCVGAMLYYPNDTIQHAGIVLGILGVAGHAFRYEDRGADPCFSRTRLVQNYSAVTGACLVVRKSIYEEVGGLDEKKLAVAFNDVDFCLKVREAGYRNVWTPFAELYHHESASRGLEDTPEKHDRFRREIEVMKERWGNILLADPAYNPNLTLAHEDFSIEPDSRAENPQPAGPR